MKALESGIGIGIFWHLFFLGILEVFLLCDVLLLAVSLVLVLLPSGGMSVDQAACDPTLWHKACLIRSALIPSDGMKPWADYHHFLLLNRPLLDPGYLHDQWLQRLEPPLEAMETWVNGMTWMLQ